MRGDPAIRPDTTAAPEFVRRLATVFGPESADPAAVLTACLPRTVPDGEGRPVEIVLDRPNRRLKVYDVEAADVDDPALAGWQGALADGGETCSKLTVYARPGGHMTWITRGYLHEGVIAGFFADGEDAHLWAAYGPESRAEAPRDGLHDDTVRLAASKEPVTPALAPGCACHRAGPGDAPAIAALMAAVFSAYPTPITPRAIGRQIAAGTHLFRFIAGPDGRLVASASAEIDHARRTAEMTDCATRPDQRGAGHMAYLLDRLAADLAADFGIRDLYTLARADEVGMNCVFGKLDYVYTGRLVNNCRMPNGWESMNIWCRHTPDADAAQEAGSRP